MPYHVRRVLSHTLGVGGKLFDGDLAVCRLQRRAGAGSHGVQAVEDPALLMHLARTGVAFDVCPASADR